MRGREQWPPLGGRESGFTIVELMLAILLFSIIVYASMSLVSTASTGMARMFAEFNSLKRVLLLQREMAEGTAAFEGYFAARVVEFGPGGDELAGACVFRLTFFACDEAEECTVEYIWWPEGSEPSEEFGADAHEVIFQRVHDGPPVPLLDGVAGFSVRKTDVGKRSLRVEIAHRVKGFSRPIVRATDGQVRNLYIDDGMEEYPWNDRVKECA